MAKTKKNRIRLKCTKCKRINYSFQGTSQKRDLELKKFCKKCKTHTLHKSK